MTTQPTHPIRWAIFGTGGVARKFVLDLAQTKDHAQAVIVASRHADNARAFAQSFGLTAAESYEAAVQADIDAVYIATPPALHEQHALMAIASGRAVLIEKPFAADAQAAARIVAAAQDANVFCMEAMWTRFQPLLGALQAAVQEGAFGEIRRFDAQFQAANIPDAESSLFATQSGGALLHRGVYPLSVAQYLLGPIAQTQSMARFGETGSDEDCAMTLRHASGALSTLYAGLRAQERHSATLYGTQATVVLDGPIYRPEGARIYKTRPAKAGTGQAGPRKFEAFRESTLGLRLSRVLARVKQSVKRDVDTMHAPYQGNGYHHQVLAVCEALHAGKIEHPTMPVADSLALMDVVETARTPAQGGQP